MYAMTSSTGARRGARRPVPRPGGAPAGGRADRGRVQAAAADERPLSAAPRLHAAGRHSLRHAVVAADAQAGPHRARVRQGLRPLHHPPEHPVQLAEAEGRCRTFWRSWPRSRCTRIQTSGNCIRNVTADHCAGAAADEIEDPRIYAEIIRQWSTLHPEFTLPAAQVQDRGHRGARTTAPPSRSTTSACAWSATTTARSASRCWSAAGSAARR